VADLQPEEEMPLLIEEWEKAEEATEVTLETIQT